MRRRPLFSLTASVAAAALSFGLLAATPGLAEAANLGDKTTFLGLEGEGDQVASLSDAIRWDLNQRGMDDGNTMSLAELKLTMGCGDEDLACFAQGGKTLGSSELVFGEVRKDGNDYVISLRSLNVETGQLNNSVERTVSFVELGEAQLGATAASLVDELYKIKPTTDELPPSGGGGGEADSGEGGETSEGEGGEVEGPADRPPREGTLVWGPYSPRPTWKWVGVGLSGALAVAGLGTAIGATVAIGANGPIRKDLLDEAEASLQDDKPSNDIDPNSNADLCDLAQRPPDPTRPNEVTNARVTQVCVKADNVATLATVGWVTTGVFAVSTALFTTLLFVHKKDATVAKLREHKVGFGGAPLYDGGFVLGGSFRF
jgi:hypothetical protein